MKSPSKKLANVPKSGIRKLFDLLSASEDTISLGIGQPDFKTPDVVVESTIDALKKERGSVYAPTRGLPELKELVAEKLKNENNIDSNPDENVIITPGGSGAITLAFASILNPGDELLMCSPNFVSYFYVSLFFDGIIQEVPRNEDHSLDEDTFERKVTEKTKCIIINSPNNPTGYAFEKKELEKIVDICIENDLYLISDEVYEKFIYEDTTHISPASLNGMEDRVITLNAASKIFSVTGFRVGYLSAPSSLTPLMENFLQYTSAGVNHPAQYGTIAGMAYARDNPGFLSETIKAYQHKRDICYKRLNEIGLNCPKAKGAFYVMPSVASTGLSAAGFSEKLIKEKGVAVVPGGTFGKFSLDKVRISFALDDKSLNEALDRIESFMKTI